MTKKQQNDAMQALTDWGCDIAGTLPRFIGSSEFYCRMLAKVPDEENFAKLGNALTEEDINTAFNAAHTLKGVLGNMGLTPMYEEACAIVEPLRAGKSEGVAEHYAALLKQRDFLKSILK
jgi:chemotaxis protein histidine kinase CheA